MFHNRRIFAIWAAILLICFSSLPPVFAASSTGGSLGIVGVGSISLPEWMMATEAKGLENQPNAGLQYDLVGLSGDAWHYARLVAYRIEQTQGPAALLFGIAKANPQILGELARPLLEKSLHKVFLESRKNHEQMNELFGYETGLHYHTEILEAFKNHDAERARDVMEQHLGGSIETLKMSGKIEDREGGTGKK